MTSALDLPRYTLDYETRCVLKLGKAKDAVGAHRYAEHPTSRILCLSHGRGDTRRLWTPDKETYITEDSVMFSLKPGLESDRFQPERIYLPKSLVNGAAEGNVVFVAHNAMFEQCIWYYIWHLRYGVPMPRRWYDTMATCAYLSVPLALDDVGDVLNLDTRKDKRGKYLLQQLTQPRKPLKAEKQFFLNCGMKPDEFPLLWRNDEDLLGELGNYCLQDHRTEEALEDTIGDLTLPEYRLWTLDQRINWRGLRIDQDLCRAAKSVVDYAEAMTTKELHKITGGRIETAGQVEKIRDYLGSLGVTLDELSADTVNATIGRLSSWLKKNDGHPDADDMRHAKRILEIRKELSRSSGNKFQKALDLVNTDGRVRGLLQYHGASTGRFAGRLLQPHNFPRGVLEAIAEALGLGRGEQALTDAMEFLVATINLGGRDAYEALQIIFSATEMDMMDALITSLRGMFIAAEGKIFRVADFSAIESVATSWLAGEEWKLEAFRTIQSGQKYEGYDDIYCATASKILKRHVSKNDGTRARQEIGKVAELAFGFWGSLGAWYNFDNSGKYTEEEIYGFNNEWRSNHPETEKLVYGLEEAAVEAVLNPGETTRYRHIRYQMVINKAGRWLSCILPNGKRLWYLNPQTEQVTLRSRKTGKPYTKTQLLYEGRDNKKGGKWSLVRTYGGMLTENCASAVSRELMVEAMVRVEMAGYPIVLTVHDEIISEVDPEHGSQEEFESLMARVPPWAKDFPVGVAGWSGIRYRKG